MHRHFVKEYNHMKNLFFILLLVFVGNLLHAQQHSSASANPDISFKLIPAKEKTWGYDIYKEGKLFIHQPSIPAMPGNTGFATKEAAEKVAKKIIDKIKIGEIPPTISIEEMKKMGAIPK